MSEASYATSKLAVSADDVEPRMILRRHARAQAPFMLTVNQSLTEIGKREIKKLLYSFFLKILILICVTQNSVIQYIYIYVYAVLCQS